MPRPCRVRRIGFTPGVTYFKPAGVPLRFMEEVSLSLDELEALRLADLEGKYHEDAAEAMGVSRPTFGRIVETARKKVATALVRGKALRMEGGNIALAGRESRYCERCGSSWWAPSGSKRRAACPYCALTQGGAASPPAAGRSGFGRESRGRFGPAHAFVEEEGGRRGIRRGRRR